MSAYKIAGRKTENTASWHGGHTGRIVKKRVYISEEDFSKYSPDTIKRWLSCGLQVEVSVMDGGKWVEIKRYENNN